MKLFTIRCPRELPTPSARPSFIVCKKEGFSGTRAGRFLCWGTLIGIVVILLCFEGVVDLGILIIDDRYIFRPSQLVAEPL